MSQLPTRNQKELVHLPRCNGRESAGLGTRFLRFRLAQFLTTNGLVQQVPQNL